MIGRDVVSGSVPGGELADFLQSTLSPSTHLTKIPWREIADSRHLTRNSKHTAAQSEKTYVIRDTAHNKSKHIHSVVPGHMDNQHLCVRLYLVSLCICIFAFSYLCTCTFVFVYLCMLTSMSLCICTFVWQRNVKLNICAKWPDKIYFSVCQLCTRFLHSNPLLSIS